VAIRLVVFDVGIQEADAGLPFTATITDVPSGQTHDAPGVVVQAGATFRVTFDVALFGNPRTIGIEAYTERHNYADPVNHPFDSADFFDVAPSPSWPDAGARWLLVGRG
jgi:hypothetical protein